MDESLREAQKRYDQTDKGKERKRKYEEKRPSRAAYMRERRKKLKEETMQTELLSIHQLKIGDLVRALSFRTPEQESKIVGTVHLIAKAFVYEDDFYIGDQIISLVNQKLESGEDPEEWDLNEILDTQLELVVMLRLQDNSFFTWWNQSFRLLDRANSSGI